MNIEIIATANGQGVVEFPSSSLS